MNDERKPRMTDEELVQAFDELFAEVSPPERDEEVDAFLRECGYEPDEVVQRVVELVEHLCARPHVSLHESLVGTARADAVEEE